MLTDSDKKYLVDLVSYFMGLFSAILFVLMVINKVFNLFGKGLRLLVRKK